MPPQDIASHTADMAHYYHAMGEQVRTQSMLMQRQHERQRAAARRQLAHGARGPGPAAAPPNRAPPEHDAGGGPSRTYGGARPPTRS